MIDELMKNPYAWLILSAISIASFAFAIYTWIVGKKVKEISVDYTSNHIVKKGKSPIPKLEMRYDGKSIDNLSSTIFYFWNSGNEVINADDLVKVCPLKIRCDSEKILDAQIIKQSDESNSFFIKRITPEEVELQFEYINCGEGVSVQVLHAGEEDKFSLDCKIKGGRKIKDCVKNRREQREKGILRALIEEVTLILPLVLGYVISMLLFKTTKLPHEEYSWLIALSTIGITIMIMVLYVKIEKRISKAFHKSVPDDLKEAK